MSKIPTQIENPNGLHRRYVVKKLIKNPDYEREGGINSPEYIAVNPDRNAEYFVLRLDEGGKDPEHIKACRIGVHAYADAIVHHLPELAKDLKARYPLL